MAKTKRSEPAEKKKRGRAAAAGEARPRISPALTLWRDAVEELQGREFADVDQALYAICDLVLTRAPLEGAAHIAETRRFIYETLSADPELLLTVKSSLKIR